MPETRPVSSSVIRNEELDHLLQIVHSIMEKHWTTDVPDLPPVGQLEPNEVQSLLTDWINGGCSVDALQKYLSLKFEDGFPSGPPFPLESLLLAKLLLTITSTLEDGHRMLLPAASAIVLTHMNWLEEQAINIRSAFGAFTAEATSHDLELLRDAGWDIRRR